MIAISATSNSRLRTDALEGARDAALVYRELEAVGARPELFVTG